MRQKLKQGVSRLLALVMSLNFIAPSLGTQAIAVNYAEDKELLMHFVWEVDSEFPVQEYVLDADGNLVESGNTGVSTIKTDTSGGNYNLIDETSYESSQGGTWVKVSTADIASNTSTIEFKTASDLQSETKVAMVVVDPEKQRVIATSEQSISESNTTLGTLKCSDNVISFKTKDGKEFNCYTQLAKLSIQLDENISIPESGELIVNIEYGNESHNKTLTYDVSTLSPSDILNIDFEYSEAADVTISWSSEPTPLSTFTMLPAEQVMVSLGGTQECLCEIIITANPISKNIGSDTGATIPTSEFGVTAITDITNCPEHTASESVPVTYKLTGNNTGCTRAVLKNDELTVDGIESEAVIEIEASATYNSITESKTFTVTISRELDAPEIKEFSYDAETDKITLTASPNGHKSATVYIDEAPLGTIKFNKTLFWYQDTEWSGKFQDLASPNPVSNISVSRNPSNPKEALISWDGGEDAENLKPIQLEAEDGTKSAIKFISISSEETTKTISINTDQYTITSTSNSCLIPIVEIPWDSNVTIGVSDYGNNKSGERTLSIPNTVIYNPNIVDDIEDMTEGGTIIVDAKENDTHDPMYPTPIIIGAEIISGEGTVEVINYDESGSGNGDYSGIVIQYRSEDGVYGETQIRYTYDKVREDIPAATGLITVNVKMRNQEPIAKDDGLDITSSLSFEDGVTTTIPASVLLNNDTDRETPLGIQISDVRDCSAGSIRLINGNVELTPTLGFGGELTFRYRITDGELKSLWATVTLLVVKTEKTPVAADVSYNMSLTAKTLAVTLNVENSSSQPWAVDSNLKAYMDGTELSTDTISLSVQYNSREGADPIPYIEVNIKDDTYFKVDDIITIPYTVKSILTGQGTSATITITMTKGDDVNDMEGYLYVHRRPIAVFNPDITKNAQGYITGATISSSREYSYDLDHEMSHALGKSGRPDYSIKGIRTWEWGVKLLTSSTWQTSTFDADTYNGSAENARSAGLTWVKDKLNATIRNNPQQAVMVSLRVRDIDGEGDIGEWSETKTLLLSSIKMPPVAMFTLDKSTYTVGTILNEFKMKITDMSYDTNGDAIKYWYWTLETPTGVEAFDSAQYGAPFNANAFSTSVANAIFNYVNRGNYNPEKPTFKLTLKVVEDTVDQLESDPYSVSFSVYKQNYPPEISQKPGADTAKIQSSTLYEIDDGLDGAVGDDWGTQTNTVHKGVINFAGLINITDDQPLSQLKVDWLFEGQKVRKRLDYNDSASATVTKSYSGKSYSPFQAPFTNTVTAQGFSPGAYKLTVTVKDSPTGNAYPPNSAQISSWRTYANKAPYHFYVVPKLDMFLHNKVNGWIDQSYRESDGATLGEAGLTLEDIVPTIGDTIELFGQTNQYVESLWGYEDRNNNGQYDAGENKFIFKKGSTDLSGKISWSAEYTIEDIEDAPEGDDLIDMRLNLVGETTWGSETGNTSRTKVKTMTLKVLPVKLSDFRVTSITDPDISTTFDGYVKTLQMQSIKFTNGQVVDGVPVGKLAADNNTTGSVMRKGYAFYFKLSSKGLKKDTDEIHIFPKFYEVEVDNSGNIARIGTQLDGYVPNKEGVYESYLTNPSDEINELYELYYEGDKIHSLNTHAEVIITTTLRVENGSEQVWSGRYGIPADAKFFPYGSTASSSNEYTGEILVSFEIVAYKNGQPRYNYVERGQWLKERELVPDSLKVVYKAQEANWKASNNFLGSVLVFDGDKSIRDEYISNPVWIE